jgi:predicted SnoaL-like aldol condensation-catalyzing enzyme
MHAEINQQMLFLPQPGAQMIETGSQARLRHVTRGIDVEGREAIRKLMTDVLAILPGRRVNCVHVAASGDVVVTEHHCLATNAASNQAVTFDYCHIFRVQNGQIVDHKEYG